MQGFIRGQTPLRFISIIILGSIWIGMGSGAIAQVIPDRTLRNERSRVRQVTDEREIIRGGAQRGNALFHSFEDFNIPTGQQVYFANPAGIDTIFSRVTGSHRSEINGTLGILGNADLFLLNPHGILFGPNAQLDIRGSFLATTANRIQFPDGREFSAVNPQDPPLLTLSTPLGLQWGNSNAPIQQQAHLSLPSGETLTLAGGQLRIRGQLTVPTGQINLISAGEQSQVQIDRSGHVLHGSELVELPDQSLGEITLDSGEVLTNNPTQQGSGNIFVVADSVLMVAGARLSTESPGGEAGDIQVYTSDRLQLQGNSQITTRAIALEGNAGDIMLQSPHIQLRNGASITSSSQSGSSGDIILQRVETLELLNGGRIGASTLNGVAGQVQINREDSPADSIEIAGRADPSSRISVRVRGDRDGTPNPNGGRAGDIHINTETLRVVDRAIITAEARRDQAIGGDIQIQANRISIESGGAVLAQARGQQGQSGSIHIQAQDLHLQGNGLLSASSEFGQGGDMTIHADHIRLRNQGAITSSSESGISGNIIFQGVETLRILTGGRIGASTRIGEAGSIHINLHEPPAMLVELSGASQPSSRISVRVRGDRDGMVRPGDAGRAGNIRIHAQTIRVADGSLITAETKRDSEQGGAIAIHTENLWVEDQSELLTRSTSTNGNAGNLEITAESIVLHNQSFISSASESGQSGQLRLRADQIRIINGSALRASNEAGESEGIVLRSVDRLELINGGRIGSSTVLGEAGNIQVNEPDHPARLIVLRGGSLPVSGISVRVRPNPESNESTHILPRAGNITLNTDRLIVSNHADITAEVLGDRGRAGTVAINAESVVIQRGGQITVSNRNGAAGQVVIQADFLSLDQGSLSALTSVGHPQTVETNGSVILRLSGLLTMREDSLISAKARRTADGGNVVIEADDGFVAATLNENNDIIAIAVRGNGGNINVNTQQIFGLESRLELTPLSDISASSQFGLDGEVLINTLDIDPVESVVALPETFIDPSQLVRQHCFTPNSNSPTQSSRFYQVGRAGIAPTPYDPLSTQDVFEDIRPPAIAATEAEEISEAIVEAQQWQMNDRGELQLTASPHPTPALNSCQFR